MIEFTRHYDGTVTGRVLDPDATLDVHYVMSNLLVGKHAGNIRKHLIALGMVEIGPDPDHPERVMFVHRPGRVAE